MKKKKNYRRSKRKVRPIGQITVKRVGDKFAICISGNPERIENVMERAEKYANKLRLKYGRRLKKDY